MNRASPGHGRKAHARVLENGLRLLVAEQPYLHTAAIGAFVRVGSRYEDSTDSGLSHFLEHMLFRGTANYPSAHQVNLAIEELGGMAYAATHADFTLFLCVLPPENLAQGVSILGDLFARPSFADVEVEKRIIREEILESLDEEGRNVDVEDFARRLLFGSHPLGLTIGGSLSNLERFGLDDLHRHMQRYYVPNNMVVCVAGAVDAGAISHLVQRSFGALSPGEAACAPIAPRPLAGPHFGYLESPGSQTDVRVCFPTFGEADPRRMALQLLTRVLDDGTSTRLQRRICDERGLAYEVFGVLDQYEDCGVFGVGATAQHGKIPAVIAEISELLWELTQQGIGQEELDKAKRRYGWALRAGLDSAEAICSHHGSAALFGVQSDMDALVESVDRVTVDEVLAVARDIIRPARLQVACVGMLGKHVMSKARKTVNRFGSNRA